MLYTGYSYEIRDVEGDYDENGPKRMRDAMWKMMTTKWAISKFF